MAPTPLAGAHTCPSCGSPTVRYANYCARCGARLAPPAASTTGTAAWDWEALRRELGQGFRRAWPALLLVGFAGVFDYRLKGQLWFTLLAGGGVSLALLLLGRFREFVKPVTALIPDRLVGPAFAAVPAALLYLARWKGTQGDGTALLTAAAIVAMPFLVAAYREPLNQRLVSFFAERNRLLPRPVRLLLVLVIPILLTFLLVHRDLGDLGALFGGTTTSPRAPTGGNTGFMIILTAILSAAAVFLLLNEPSRERSRGHSPGRPPDA